MEVIPLDNIIPEDVKMHFIKIDVEGGEFGVLKGGLKLIKRCNPLILFEFGMGASEFYGTTPSLLFNFFDSELSYNIFLLPNYCANKKPMTLNGFVECYENNDDYYFIAGPKNR